MTTQEGQLPPQETVTESLMTGNDPVSREQQALDQDKAGEAPATPVERAEYDRQQAELRRLQGDIRGMQSLLQRNETHLKQMADERTALDLEAKLATLPEEQQALGQMLGGLMKEVTTIKSQQAAAPATGATADRRAFVEGFGVNPDDSRINYGILDSASGSDQSRMVDFTDTIYLVKNDKASQAPPAAAPEVRPPGTEEAPQTRGLIQDENALLDNLIQGNITPREFAERKRQLGSPLSIG